MKPIIGFAVLVLFAVADGQVESNELEAGRNIFRRYSKTDKWFQNQVEDRRLYEAFVHDLDGDGLLDVVYADGDNHDFSGCLWSAIRFKKEGDLVSSDLMGFDKSINIQARSDQFRKIYFKGERPRLAVVNALVYDLRTPNRSEEHLVNCDAVLRINSEGCFLYESIKGGVESAMFTGGVAKIQVASSCMFEGSGLWPRADAARDNDLQRVVACDSEGDRVPRLLLELKKLESLDSSSSICSHSVICYDEDNDGDADVFLTSEASRHKSGKFVWHLYRNEDGKFVRTDRTVIAGTNDFCRVITYTRDPQLVILGGPGGSPKDIRRIITDRYFHRIERLPCQTCPASGADAKHSDIDPRGAK